MKLLIALLVVALNVHAATDNPDGSVTLSREEAKSFIEYFESSQAALKQAEQDRPQAIKILLEMQKEIDRLEKRKCT